MRLPSSFLEVEVMGETLRLLPERAIYWPGRKILLLADLHLGKAGHFRKHGMAIPSQTKDLNILIGLLDTWQPERVIFLGDLFHSQHNGEWDSFGEAIKGHTAQFELVPGNHDILAPSHYQEYGIHLLAETVAEGPFLLRHHPPGPEEKLSEKGYVLAGHLHPGIKLIGKGRQSLRLPCFIFGPDLGLLPAFGGFTGLALVQPGDEEQVYMVAEGEIIKVAVQKG